MKLRVLIVDDEPLAREGVALALGDEQDIDVVGACEDGESAVRAIQELDPDLVFLDIKMPGRTGFEVIEAIGTERMPAVVFLTAYEEHALEAFRVNAIDYLLKPIDTAEFRRALARAKQAIASRDWRARAEGLEHLLARVRSDAGAPERIVVRTSGRVYLLAPEEITWVEADGDYVTIHTPRKAHLVRESLKEMERQLADHGFRRIHRSALVNLRCIRELVAKDSGDHDVVLQDETTLRLSRSHKDALFAALKGVR